MSNNIDTNALRLGVIDRLRGVEATVTELITVALELQKENTELKAQLEAPKKKEAKNV